jgi:hypothetical protein
MMQFLLSNQDIGNIEGILITICSSMKNKEKLKELLKFLRENSIDAQFPNLEIKVPETGMTPELMMNLQNDHFKAIKSSNIVYVFNPGKYIGRMVSIEIGYAKAIGKYIIFFQKTEQIELNVLADDFQGVEGLLRVQKNYV